MRNSESIVSGILRLLRTRGHHPTENGLPAGPRLLKCAALAGDAGECDAVITACLLHLYDCLLPWPKRTSVPAVPRYDPAERSAEHLSAWFLPDVVEPVRLKAAARRYLCWSDPTYFLRLSASVQRRLADQGGFMTDAEALNFEVHPHASAALRLQRYDDLTQSQDPILPGVETFRPLLLSQLRRTLAERSEAVEIRLSPLAASAETRRRRDHALHPLGVWTADPVWCFET